MGCGLEVSDIQLWAGDLGQMLRDPVAMAGQGIFFEAGQSKALVLLHEGLECGDVVGPGGQDVLGVQGKEAAVVTGIDQVIAQVVRDTQPGQMEVFQAGSYDVPPE